MGLLALSWNSLTLFLNVNVDMHTPIPFLNSLLSAKRSGTVDVETKSTKTGPEVEL